MAFSVAVNKIHNVLPLPCLHSSWLFQILMLSCTPTFCSVLPVQQF